MEILLVAVIALIVFGPEKLPDLARRVGKTAAELRRIAQEAKEEFQADLDVNDEEDDDEEPAVSAEAAPAPKGGDREDEER
jgi:sec-independent protein translocase protein TatB